MAGVAKPADCSGRPAAFPTPSPSGFGRYLFHKDAGLSQRVWAAGDQEERSDAGCFPAADLVEAGGAGADHVVGVGVVRGAVGWLGETYAGGAGDVAGAADAF